MKPKWLLEEDTFEENLDGIKEAIKAQGMELQMAKYVPFEGMKFDKHYDSQASDCIITYGSLGMVRQVLQKTKWIPGAWCNLEHFKCSYYYPRLGAHLLNSDYVMMPYGDLKRQRDLLFEAFNYGAHDELFMRPDSGFKSFTGGLVEQNETEYNKRIEYFGFYDVEPETLVLVAKPQKIIEEWRLVVVNKEVVAASQYKESGLVRLKTGCPQGIWDYANEVAQVWQPEACWVIDVCHTKSDELKVVEINSFSCSGLYVADKPAIIERVAAAAVAEYNEYQNERVIDVDYAIEP